MNDTDVSRPDDILPQIAVVGVHGHGRSHFERVKRMHHDGRVVLLAVADPRDVPAADLPEGARRFADLDSLLAAVSPDVTVVSTPIHTHAVLTEAAMRAGSDVFLEKPPTATLAEFDRLRATAAETGRLCQVGFQSLGSGAVGDVRARIADGRIGTVTGYAATACWVRSHEYWQRASWAGKRRLNGQLVGDGALGNPLAHAVATACVVDGAHTAADVGQVELDLFHANDIEADDTAAARVTFTDGRVLTLAVTLCAATRQEPCIIIEGTAGRLVLWYTLDLVQEYRRQASGDLDPFPDTVVRPREDLFENLLAARRDPGVTLLSPLEGTGGFMRVLDAIVHDAEPRSIDPAFTTLVVDEAGSHVVIDGIEDAVRDVLRSGRTFTEQGLPWAVSA